MATVKKCDRCNQMADNADDVVSVHCNFNTDKHSRDGGGVWDGEWCLECRNTVFNGVSKLCAPYKARGPRKTKEGSPDGTTN